MNDTKTLALNKAITLLRACGAKYKVIAENGTEYGELKVITGPVKRRKGEKYGWGALTEHVRPHLIDMNVGSVATIPFSPTIDVQDVMASTSRVSAKLFGPGNYICARAKTGIEVLRTA